MSDHEPKVEGRSPDQLRQHYLIEKELAARLRTATRAERRHLYTEVYDELFKRVPDHPQLALKVDEGLRRRTIAERLELLKGYLKPNSTYLELGPGDCSLALEIAKQVRRVYAVDVSREITRDVSLPDNFELIISDGSSIPVPDDSMDLAYSDQLMEHLHIEDAREQLQNVHRVLAPGGRYICITPNRLSGPHDVSRNFDDVATGFHLREYSVTELSQMLRAAGFRQLQVLVGARGIHIRTPTAFIKLVESILARTPRGLGRIIARGLPLRLILGIKMVATK
ncbi:MAG TPA: methyltransferase domain-containing protein [Pyrinomonadaceae bacterium]|jgi:SAM-dependent methyltransferase